MSSSKQHLSPDMNRNGVSPSTSSLHEDREDRIKHELFQLIESGNREKVRQFLMNDDGYAAQVMLTAVDPNVDKKYTYDDDVEVEANELLGPSMSNLNAIQIAIFLLDEDMALDILQFVENESKKLGSKMVLLAFLGMMWGHGNTTLHLASFQGMSQLVSRLLELGASPTKKNQKKYTAIDCSGNPETSEMFTKSSIVATHLEKTQPIEDIAPVKQISRIRSNSNPTEPLKYGTLRKASSMAVSEKPKSAIMKKKGGPKKAVKFNYEAVLLEAAREGDLTILKDLLGKQKVDVNYNDLGKEQTALHIACGEGFLKVVSYLLELGANPNLVDLEGWSPLHCAAANHQVEIIRILMEHPQIDPNVYTVEEEGILDVLDDEDEDYEQIHKSIEALVAPKLKSTESGHYSLDSDTEHAIPKMESLDIDKHDIYEDKNLKRSLNRAATISRHRK